MEEQANYVISQLTPEELFKGIGAAVKQMAAEAVTMAAMGERSKFAEMLECAMPAIQEMHDELPSQIAEQFKTVTVQLVDDFIQRSQVSILRQKVSAIPNRIMVSRQAIDEKRQALRTTRQSLSDAEQSVKESEAALMAEIAGEVDTVSGKPKFSNDKARGAELIKRKREDHDYLAAYQAYQGVKQQVEEAENELATHDTELKCLEYEFQAAVAQLKSVTAEIGFYVAALGAAGEVKL